MHLLLKKGKCLRIFIKGNSNILPVMEVYAMKLNRNKKGVFEQIGALGIGAVGLAVTLAVVFLVFSNLADNTQIAADGNATYAVEQAQTAVGTLPGWIGLIILVAIAALILLLVRGLRS